MTQEEVKQFINTNYPDKIIFYFLIKGNWLDLKTNIYVAHTAFEFDKSHVFMEVTKESYDNWCAEYGGLPGHYLYHAANKVLMLPNKIQKADVFIKGEKAYSGKFVFVDNEKKAKNREFLKKLNNLG